MRRRRESSADSADKQAQRDAFLSRKEEWAQLVRRCAIVTGRLENNIKAYVGNAVLNRQLHALGEAVPELLAMSKKDFVTAGDRARASEILAAGRKNVAEKDNGSKAALSAVNMVYGTDAKFASEAGRKPTSAQAQPLKPIVKLPRPPARTLGLAVGDYVRANFMADGTWHDAKIHAVNADGTFAVLYDDGDFEKAVARQLIRKKKGVNEQRAREKEAEQAAGKQREEDEEEEEEEEEQDGGNSRRRPLKMARGTEVDPPPVDDGGKSWRAAAAAFLAEHDTPTLATAATAAAAVGSPEGTMGPLSSDHPLIVRSDATPSAPSQLL